MSDFEPTDGLRALADAVRADRTGRQPEPTDTPDSLNLPNRPTDR